MGSRSSCLERDVKRVSDETFVRLRDAGLLGLEESIRVYEWLEAHKEQPENPVFQFVFRSYYRIDSAGLTSAWKVRYFEFLSQRERSLQTILEGLYHIPTKKKVKSLQFSFATKLLHTLDTSKGGGKTQKTHVASAFPLLLRGTSPFDVVVQPDHHSPDRRAIPRFRSAV
jgi:hypothetical protein